MLARLRTTALNRGLLGGSRLWIGVGAVVWTIRLFQWLSRADTGVIYREELGPGQAVVIRHAPPEPSRHRARRSARAEKASSRRHRRASAAAGGGTP